MEIGFIVALLIAVPVILIPAALIWWINIGGIVKAIKAHKAKAARTEYTEEKIFANVEPR